MVRPRSLIVAVALLAAACSSPESAESFVSDAELVDVRTMVVNQTGVVDLSLSDHRALGDRVCSLGERLDGESATVIDEFDLDRYATAGMPVMALWLVGQQACPDRMDPEPPFGVFTASGPVDRVRSDSPPDGYPPLVSAGALVDGLGYASTGRWALTGGRTEPAELVVEEMVEALSDLGWRTEVVGPVSLDGAQLWSVDLQQGGFDGVLEVLETTGPEDSRVLLVIVEPS